MPHLIVEHSSNVAAHHDIDALLDVLLESTLAQGVAPVPGIRIRAVNHERTRIADGSNENYAFIAITARLGPGRDAATKMSLIETTLDAAQAHIASEGGPLIIAWSFEVQEIDAAFRINRNEIAAHMNKTDASSGR